MSERVKKGLCLILAYVMLFVSIPGVALATERGNPVSLSTEPVTAAPEIEEYLFSDENRFDADLFMDDLLAGDPFSYLNPCEPFFSEATLDENFEDNSVIVVLDRAKSRETSREDRTFTARDFRDVGAVYVEDLMSLSERSNAYAQQLWDAERRMVLSERSRFSTEQMRLEVQQAYFEAREEAEQNTMWNFDEFRRILLIRLDRNCRENVLRAVITPPLNSRN